MDPSAMGPLLQGLASCPVRLGLSSKQGTHCRWSMLKNHLLGITQGDLRLWEAPDKAQTPSGSTERPWEGRLGHHLHPTAVLLPLAGPPPGASAGKSPGHRQGWEALTSPRGP